jgi:signal transduction histidine kinase
MQILGNLPGNAAKYTPEGGTVTLSVSTEVDVLEMSIRDNGIGISAKALPFIFEPFVQDVHAVGFNGAGLGIGLTMVRELVEAHGSTGGRASSGLISCIDRLNPPNMAAVSFANGSGVTACARA